MKDMGTVTELLKLAKERFGELSEAEVKFFTATAKGENEDYKSGSKEENNLENADKWGNERVLRANVIEWLCTDRKASQFVTHKGIDVVGVRVDGELDLSFTTINFPFGFFDSVFKNDIYLNDSKLKTLNLGGTYTKNIQAAGMKAEGGVYLRWNFSAKGEICFTGAEIGGDLDCQKGEFINDDGPALCCDRIIVKGDVILSEGFKAVGGVRFYGAQIGGNLECGGGEFINPNGNALSADRSRVSGNVFLRNGFKAKGGVVLTVTEIGGVLSCDNGDFINPEGCAICADSINVKGSVFLRNGFKSEGEVNLTGSKIGIYLECNNGEFLNPDGKAINAEGINVKGSANFRNGFKAEGEINLVGAIINGHLVYEGVKSPKKVKLDLQSAKIGTLRYGEDSWPKEGYLYLHGLEYDKLDDRMPKNIKSMIKWLRLNGGKGFSPQPYEQLASVLEKSGHEKDAKEVHIAKNKDRIKHSPKLGILKKVLYRLFGLTMGYGYKPLNMLWAMFLFLLIGWFVFGVGEKYGLITPAQGWAYKTDGAEGKVLKNEYPAFNFWIYSIDTFIPLVDLQQSKYWLPNAKMGNNYESIINIDLTWMAIKSGGAIRVYLWFHVAFGWILTTLFVVGLTGLVRK